MSFRVEFRPGGAEALARVHSAAERGVRMAVEHWLGESRKEVPIEEGTLERSGRATTEGLKGAVSYDTPYAVYQHERMDLQHDSGRKAKYLEDPGNREAGTMAEIIAAQVRRATR